MGEHPQRMALDEEHDRFQEQVSEHYQKLKDVSDTDMLVLAISDLYSLLSTSRPRAKSTAIARRIGDMKRVKALYNL